MSSGASGIRESKFLRERERGGGGGGGGEEGEKGGGEEGEKGGGEEREKEEEEEREKEEEEGSQTATVPDTLSGFYLLAQHTHHHGNRFSSLKAHGGSSSPQGQVQGQGLLHIHVS